MERREIHRHPPDRGAPDKDTGLDRKPDSFSRQDEITHRPKQMSRNHKSHTHTHTSDGCIVRSRRFLAHRLALVDQVVVEGKASCSLASRPGRQAYPSAHVPGLSSRDPTLPPILKRHAVGRRSPPTHVEIGPSGSKLLHGQCLRKGPLFFFSLSLSVSFLFPLSLPSLLPDNTARRHQARIALESRLFLHSTICNMVVTGNASKLNHFTPRNYLAPWFSPNPRFQARWNGPLCWFQD